MTGTATIKAIIEAAEVADPPPETLNETVARLGALPPLEYDRVRDAEAERLKVRRSTLDQEIQKWRDLNESDDGGDRFLSDLTPWPEPVDAGELLDKLVALIRRYLVLPSGAAEAIALWILHAHAHDAFNISPVLAITSPTPECGKTTCLTLLGPLVPRACPLPTLPQQLCSERSRSGTRHF